MSLTLNLKEQDLKNAVDVNAAACHALPCHINFSGPCNAESYFAPNVEKGEGKEGVKCSYRGYPLLGQKVNIPAGYNGYVIKEGLTHGENRQLDVVSSFSGFTAWNYDQIPSGNDTLKKAQDWVHVANAIHKKVTTTS